MDFERNFNTKMNFKVSFGGGGDFIGLFVISKDIFRLSMGRGIFKETEVFFL